MCSLFLLLSASLSLSNAVLSPVVLVPGDGGSRFMARLNKSSGPHYWCYQHTSDYFLLWLNLDILISQSLDCFVDNMRLHYNRTTHRSHNTPGVDTMVPDFGSTAAVELLGDGWFQSYTRYFKQLVDQLVAVKGYSRQLNVFGAPYDFRRAPNELGEFFANLTRLVEHAYTLNNNTRVTLVAHSYGCPLTLYWLQRRSDVWKQRYIERFISLAGPYAGTALTFRVYSAGYNLGIGEISSLRMRGEQRTSPSLAFLSPSRRLWRSDHVFLTTPQRNYTLGNVKQFFTDLGIEDTWEIWQDVHDMYNIEIPPGVATDCVAGHGVTTVERTDYTSVSSFPDAPAAGLTGDGDGTVNWASLSWCRRWIGRQTPAVSFHAVEGVDHMGVIQNNTVIDMIVRKLIK